MEESNKYLVLELAHYFMGVVVVFFVVWLGILVIPFDFRFGTFAMLLGLSIIAVYCLYLSIYYMKKTR